VPPRARSALAIAALAASFLAAPSTASAFTHVVAPGESLTSVAAADGLSVEELAAANGISGEAELISGSDLTIPAQGSGEALSESGEGRLDEDGDGDFDEGSAAGAEIQPAEASATSPVAASGYLVEPGDTLSAIAARSGTTVEALAAANGLDPEGLLLYGTTLNLPGAGSEGAETAGAGETTTGVPVAEAPPYPTEESLSPSEVGAVAEEHGVSPSFAEAIAEQESGFNNSLTSSADARGEMQIIPETWSFISHELAGPPPLEPASASSNVRGGVLLLRYLLNENGGDPAGAAAGYFQGLESVRQNGMYPETEEYVNSVIALQHRFSGE
jgi:LysM repeat protein